MVGDQLWVAFILIFGGSQGHPVTKSSDPQARVESEPADEVISQPLIASDDNSQLTLSNQITPLGALLQRQDATGLQGPNFNPLQMFNPKPLPNFVSNAFQGQKQAIDLNSLHALHGVLGYNPLQNLASNAFQGQNQALNLNLLQATHGLNNLQQGQTMVPGYGSLQGQNQALNLNLLQATPWLNNLQQGQTMEPGYGPLQASPGLNNIQQGQTMVPGYGPLQASPGLNNLQQGQTMVPGYGSLQSTTALLINQLPGLQKTLNGIFSSPDQYQVTTAANTNSPYFGYAGMSAPHPNNNLLLQQPNNNLLVQQILANLQSQLQGA